VGESGYWGEVGGERKNKDEEEGARNGRARGWKRRKGCARG
jgi:hypothetical protein